MGIVAWEGAHPVLFMLVPALLVLWGWGIARALKHLADTTVIRKIGKSSYPVLVLMTLLSIVLPLIPTNRFVVFGYLDLYLALLFFLLYFLHPLFLGYGCVELVRHVSDRMARGRMAPPPADQACPSTDSLAKSLQRRAFLGWTVGAVPGILTSSVFASAGMESTPKLVERQYTYSLSRRAAADSVTECCRVSFFSDLHLGFFFPESLFESLLDSIRKFRPDAIVFAGDLVDHDVRHAEYGRAFWRDLVRLGPVYAVLGNHDIWAGADAVQEWEAGAGLRVLRDASAEIGSRSGEGIRLYGATDFSEKRTGYFRDPKIAAADCAVVVAHNPNTAFLLDERPSLVLAGHTHGGQVRIPGIGSLINQADRRFQPGLTQVGHRSVLTTAGMGYTGYPLRINCDPEVVHLCLCV